MKLKKETLDSNVRESGDQTLYALIAIIGIMEFMIPQGQVQIQFYSRLEKCQPCQTLNRITITVAF